MVRNGLVYVSHFLRPCRLDGSYYAPLQRERAGLICRYVGPSAFTQTIYYPCTNTTVRRVIHLVEDPTGRLRKALAEDLTLVEEPAR